MVVQTLKWIGDEDGFLEIIDQRKLPNEFVKIKCRDISQLYDAIKTLAVRGAPAIGVAAAYAPLLALQGLAYDLPSRVGLEVVEQACDYLAQSRPTAVNLFWALERIRSKAKNEAKDPHSTVEILRNILFAEADAIFREDAEMCLKIGQNGRRFVKHSDTILTHCNAGALATAGRGTALSVIYQAAADGKKVKVYVDETRPLLQGARLTAWELDQAGIDVTVICDNMAGFLMKQGKIDLVITGADRIAANGDAANKIGTYSLSVLAKEHNIPFYIAAPSSTFDLSLETGDRIPIEQREPDEVVNFAGTRIAPKDIKVYNPAFDVTCAGNITAIITEKGVIESPNTDGIRRHITGEKLSSTKS